MKNSIVSPAKPAGVQPQRLHNASASQRHQEAKKVVRAFVPTYDLLKKFNSLPK
ncbi:MAG: hypothetical protein HGA33_02000 [Candidatus Moranbacteria bacterium]|nr:hypothetical protein [Candidatus Moranbacteria bacterium]